MYDQQSSAHTRSPVDTQATQAWSENDTESPGAVLRGTEAAGSAAGEVAHTAKQQTRQVANEASHQARRLAGDVRQRLGDQAGTQQQRAAKGLRQAAEEMRSMAADRSGTPAGTVVHHIADRSDRLAGYLADRQPQDLLDEVTRFARQRPGVFLMSALAAGFVAGRFGKSVLGATQSTQRSNLYGGHESNRSYEPNGAYDVGSTYGTTANGTSYSPDRDVTAPGTGPAVQPGTGPAVQAGAGYRTESDIAALAPDDPGTGGLGTGASTTTGTEYVGSTYTPPATDESARPSAEERFLSGPGTGERA